MKKHPIILHIKSFLASPVDYFSAWRRYASLGTQAERWSDLGIFDESWDERTAMMAVLVPPGSSVLEFGSGREQLEWLLPEGCSYQPCDIVARAPRTLVCDLNVTFPVLTQRYDVIVFSGVLEYIHDIPRLLRHVRQHCDMCLLSYAATDYLESMTTRVGDGWVSHFSEASLLNMIDKAGFCVEQRQSWRNQVIYHLSNEWSHRSKSLQKLFGDLSKTVGANSFQFLLILITTPLMTRLYDASAYATFGIINSASGVIIGVGLLSLPNAYCIEKNVKIRGNLLQAMVLLLLGLVSLSVVGAVLLAVADALHMGIDISSAALALLPVLVLTYGARQIIVSMGTQRARFSRLSLGQVVEPLCSRGGSIALAAGFGGNPAFILLAVAVGHLSTIAIQLQRLPRKLSSQWPLLMKHVPQLLPMLRKFSDFVVFGTLSKQAQSVAMLGLQMGIAAFFSSHLAGHYILAVSILTLPMSLLALSTAPVVYRHFIEMEHTHPALLPRHFLWATFFYLVAGFVILLPVYLFGETIFRIAFGEAWTHAGAIAATLSIAYVAMFAATGVQSIFMVTHRLKLQCTIEIITSFSALVLAIFWFKTMEFDRAIFYLSLIWLLRSIVILCAALVATLQYRADTHT